jgi:alcohol dehydrogenase class IV
MAFNAGTVPEEMRRIGAALGDADDATAAAGRLVGRLGLPANLTACGVGEDDLDAVARLSERSPSVRANPRPVSSEDARAILQAAFEGAPA